MLGSKISKDISQYLKYWILWSVDSKIGTFKNCLKIIISYNNKKSQKFSDSNGIMCKYFSLAYLNALLP
jgi:hypothetical protein